MAAVVARVEAWAEALPPISGACRVPTRQSSQPNAHAVAWGVQTDAEGSEGQPLRGVHGWAIVNCAVHDVLTATDRTFEQRRRSRAPFCRFHCDPNPRLALARVHASAGKADGA